MLLASASLAQAAEGEPEVSSGILVRAISAIHPVLGADDEVHLLYELEVVNHSPFLISADRIEALGGSETLLDLEGDALAKRTLISGGETGRVFGPSHSGYIYINIDLPKSMPLPKSIRHRIATTVERRAAPGDDHHAAADPAAAAAGPGLPGTSFSGVEATVDPVPAIAISAPLRGPDWLAANGCCDELTGHRMTVFSINGSLSVPEKFAIDFVQLDREHRVLNGPIEKLSSYAYYGVPVYSVGAGTVVRAEDGAPEQVPGALPPGMTVNTAGGNNVVVDLGNGRFAVYAHLQPGSIRVKPGERVRRGDILGKLGNTGNTTNPHLHFQIADRPSVVAGNGLPFVIDDFTSAGVVPDLDPLFDGKPATFNSRLAGRHLRQMPLNNSVVSFH